MPEAKVDMQSLPARMRMLAIDPRGYPVPWFVAQVDGKPEFRAMDGEKFRRAVKEKLCWVCGCRLGINVIFVIGPMCAVTRTTSEPPCHRDCAIWSVQNCPFLNNPRMVRREDDFINHASAQENIAGCGIMRNPGISTLWYTRSYEMFSDPMGKGSGVLFTVGEPEKVEWYREGRTATLAEVRESIDTGLPILQAQARLDGPAGVEALAKAVQRVERYLPAAAEVSVA